MTRAVDFTPQEEKALLTALRANEAVAYEELVRRYWPTLLAVARRLVRDEHDAQDVVQDGLLSAFRALPTFRGESRLSTWLHRIVVNAALMRARRQRRRPEESIEPLLPTFTQDGHHATAIYEWNTSEATMVLEETRAAVRVAIDALPESYRTVLVLHDIDEYTTHDVATLMGVTTNAIKVRLHRARQALLTRLTPVFGVGHAAATRHS